MKIHEYQARELFQNAAISVPNGYLCKTPEEARDAARSIGKPVVIKSQILVAGRGKAGGIKSAANENEAFEISKNLLGSAIKGIKVTSVLVVQSVKSKNELYLGFTIDRARRKIALIASSEGGIDLEELARTKPDKIFRREIDPILGLHPFEARDAASSVGLDAKRLNEFVSICQKMFQIFLAVDADLLESNPLAIDDQTGSLVALDSRITLDDNAIFRHPEYHQVDEELAPLEREAAVSGLAFVQLDGNIGIIGNGAGLVMATLDVVAHYGGRPANFLDMGGGSRADDVYKAVRICLEQKNLASVFLNVLGGITKCDEVALGLVRALKDSGSNVPFVVRMVGTNEEEGRKILATNGISYLDSMEEAAEEAVKISYRAKPS
jgi:succinyl-CoA synthetase beta subunit